MLSRFHTNQRVTDRQTDRITISISRVSSSMLTRDKNGYISVNIILPSNLLYVLILSGSTYLQNICTQHTANPNLGTVAVDELVARLYSPRSHGYY